MTTVMMKKSAIPKVSIESMLATATVPSVVDADKAMSELGAQAEAVLGYQPLQKAVDPRSTILARALQKLGIEVLDFAQVEQYKEEALRAAVAGERDARRVSGTRKRKQRDEDDEDDEYDDERDELGWEEYKIAEYTRAIPAHVLMKAIQVKTALPTVQFLVDELVVKEKADPFLIAMFRDEKYYIEVWDEPTFEGRKTKPRK
jgi:hypothetical protein